MILLLIVTLYYYIAYIISLKLFLLIYICYINKTAFFLYVFFISIGETNCFQSTGLLFEYEPFKGLLILGLISDKTLYIENVK
jgi:hypothetical protein